MFNNFTVKVNKYVIIYFLCAHFILFDTVRWVVLGNQLDKNLKFTGYYLTNLTKMKKLLLLLLFPLLSFSQQQITKVTFNQDDELRLGAEPDELIRISVHTTESISNASLLISSAGWGDGLASQPMTSESDTEFYYDYVIPADSSLTNGALNISFSVDALETYSVKFAVADVRQPEGQGNSFRPYEINSIANLSWVFDSHPGHTSANFKQTQDLDLQGYSWMSKTDFNYPNFNLSSPSLNYFNYDGNGHTLQNISLTETNKKQNFGFFGNIAYGSIMNLTIDNMTYDILYTGDENLNNVGLLCGSLDRSYLFDVIVKNSTLTITSKSYVNNVGALMGRIGYSRFIENVTSQDNTITIKGTPNSTNHYSNYVGGLFGNMDYLDQYNSLSKFYSKNNTITLSGYGNYIGGLTNMNYIFSGQTETNNSEYLTLSEFHTENISITITDDVFDSNGNGRASTRVGGLFGSLKTNSNYSDKTHAELIKSSATGTITLKMGREVGGLIGNAEARISDVYSKVDINIDLGTYADWQNTSGNTTWGSSKLNEEYTNIGGLIGVLTYKGRALSNSYSAASFTVSGINFTDDLLYIDYTGDGNLDQPKRWGSVIGNTNNNNADEFVADNVFYNSDLVSYEAVAPLDYNDSNPRQALVNAVGKTTADLKLISNFMKKGWDFVTEVSNGTDDIWDINNGTTATAINEGYPIFSHQIENGPLAVMPIILTPSSDFSTGLMVSTRQLIATSALGGTSTISATSSNSDIVSVVVENTVTDGDITTSDLVFTYNGIEGTTGNALITVIGENTNTETGEIEFTYFQDQNAPIIETLRFYNGTQMRLGGKTGENIRVEVVLSESAGETNTIDLTGWGPDVTADMSIDSENDKKLFYNFSIPEDATQTEAKVTVSINASDVSNNTSFKTSNFVVADVRQPEGQGNSFTPYQINSIANLSWVFDSHPGHTSANFKQTQDLDLQGYSWMSKTDFNYPNFNLSSPSLNYFNYDGNGHTLQNISLTETNKKQNFGFFGNIAYGSIMNLTIDNMTYDILYTGDENLNNVGLLCGSLDRSYLFDVIVKNSTLTITSKSYVNNVGALMGRIGYSRFIENVTSQDNTITIKGTPNSTNHYSNYVGGLFGNMDYLDQYNSLSKFYSKNNTITLSGYGNYIGGLTNMNYIFSGQTETNNSEYLTLSEFHTENISITITDDVFDSNGNGRASTRVGGLFGSLKTNSNYSDKTHAELIKSSATGTITLKMGREVGGLIGNAEARISDVYSKVDINIDLGTYADWQNTSGNTTWGSSKLNEEYTNIGGLIGVLTYKGRALSNSYSAASFTVSGINFTDDLLYIDYTGDGNLDQPKRWGSVIGNTNNNNADEFVADNVFYNTDLVSYEAVAPWVTSNPRQALVNAVGKTTAEMTVSTIYEAAIWDISTNMSSSSIWGINAELNGGYPYFNDIIDSYFVPTITLIGDPNIYLLLEDTYTELGATAVDYTGVDISNDIVIDSSNVDTLVEGIYNVTYNVSDSDGNIAEQVIRKVYVKPASFYKPVINLLGSNPLELDINVDFNDPGAIATTYLGTYISEQIIVTGTDVLDTSTEGTYALYYNVTDAEGNVADQVIRTVSVVDNTVYVRPEITLVGAAEVYVLLGTDYVEENATAEDSEGVSLTTAIVIDATSVDTSVEGDYTVTYDVTDANGTEAIQVERIVYVRSEAFFIPTLVLNGEAEISLELNAMYGDLGAVATDYYGNDISASIVLTGTVDTSVEGEYLLNYNVTDAEGNAAIQISRTVTVGTTLGLDGFSTMEDVKLYPNPTFDKVFVKLVNLKRLEVYDINSRKLFESTEHQVSLSSYDSGIYFIKVINKENHSRMFKIILK
mgnify:CR=1 FL=1